MIKITGPEQFKTTAWKNGQGQTTELAINPGGLLGDFDWRISVANMTDSGAFSSFVGYQRHLLLLNGTGLKLVHDAVSKVLINHLEVTTFDGANQTCGDLVAGPVQNFNVMTKQTSCLAIVSSHLQIENFEVHKGDVLFVYVDKGPLSIKVNNEVTKVSEGCLVKVSSCAATAEIDAPTYVVVRISTIKNKN